MISLAEIKREELDLLNYFKFITQCKKCKRIYGYDNEEKSEEAKLCPICLKSKSGFKKKRKKWLPTKARMKVATKQLNEMFKKMRTLNKLRISNKRGKKR